MPLGASSSGDIPLSISTSTAALSLSRIMKSPPLLARHPRDLASQLFLSREARLITLFPRGCILK
jgi:hypothetical protein